jgi:hypothetical protein
MKKMVKRFPVAAEELQSEMRDTRDTMEGEMNDSTSPAKEEANRRNSRKSTGPNDASSTRYNAAKHGLLAQGITELDDGEAYTALLQRLDEAHQPAGDIEEFLVERIALAMVRLRRIARMEAEYITGELHPPVRGPSGAERYRDEDQPLLDPGLPAPMSGGSVMALAGTFQRYESAMENKLYRAMNQLERLQRMRQGEHISAPASLDVTVHAGEPGAGSFGNSQG